jgi:hypothetical protein
MKGHKEVLAFLVDHMTSTAAVAVCADGVMDTKDKKVRSASMISNNRLLWILFISLSICNSSTLPWY